MSRTLIVLALRRALACKGYSVRCQILLRNIKLFDILLSSRGVDGRGGLPPRQSSSASAVRWGVPKVNLKFEPS